MSFGLFNGFNFCTKVSFQYPIFKSLFQSCLNFIEIGYSRILRKNNFITSIALSS